jgi:phospholipid/cholesterol/gamma-HCH transport system substrate-binding protein
LRDRRVNTSFEGEGEPSTDSLSTARTVALLAATLAAVALAAVVLFGGARSYTVTARFINAGQLVKGNPVQTGGAPIGSVAGIEITPEGHADVELEIDDDHAPLRAGTRARIKQLSLSGIANRYVELTLPPDGSAEIPDGGRIGTDHTTTAVDLDELFNTLDPKTRRSLQGFFKGSANQFRGRGRQARAGLRYLNPALATSSRLFHELTRDHPVLERFLVDSARLVTALADRRDDLAALIGNLNETTSALGSEKAALAESIGRLPPFMRRANTTFVNLRATLDEVDPLVDASKPVARALGPFLEQARGFARDARPTVRDLSRTVRRRGRSNDLIELMRSFPPLADIALDRKERFLSPGGRRVSVGEVDGAFPETVKALAGGRPEIALGRAYTTDFLGWFDDFSTTGPGFDALGAVARAHVSFAENLAAPTPGPVRQGQYRRCPGSAEAPAPDGSNVLSAAEREELQCDESARATGDVQ